MTFDSLEALSEHIGECDRCALGATRTKLVFGVGRSDADVMFVGEAPGKNEDLQGEPFVGAAGKLLDELLASAGLERSSVYIANILKCRPPKNRDPQADEIDTCTPFLREQTRLIDPKVIVTMGNFATKFILKTDVGITRLRGTTQSAGRFTVLPIFHPAAALYDVTKKEVLLDDFARLKAMLEASRPEDNAAEVPADDSLTEAIDDAAPPSDEAEQPSLFEG
jgi:DNA polymerase